MVSADHAARPAGDTREMRETYGDTETAIIGHTADTSEINCPLKSSVVFGRASLVISGERMHQAFGRVLELF